MLYFLLRLVFKLGVRLHPAMRPGREGRLFQVPLQAIVVSLMWRYLMQLVLRMCSLLLAWTSVVLLISLFVTGNLAISQATTISLQRNLFVHERLRLPQVCIFHAIVLSSVSASASFSVYCGISRLSHFVLSLMSGQRCSHRCKLSNSHLV